MTTSPFQDQLEHALNDAFSAEGAAIDERLVTRERTIDRDAETIVYLRVGGIELWLHESEAFIGGSVNGEELDDRFEAAAFRNSADLINAFVPAALRLVKRQKGKMEA